MKLAFTPEAEEQADECDAWWPEHRDARDLFARELAGAKELLRKSPRRHNVRRARWVPCPARAATED